MSDVIATIEFTVLDKPKIEVNEQYSYARALLQVFINGVAGNLRVYSKEKDFKKPVDLEGMDKGDYLVDLEIASANYGVVEPRLVRPRKKDSRPQPKKDGKEAF